MNPAVRQYLHEIERTLATGKATEHSYRPAFKALVESFGKGIEATNEPKRVKCGAPDFIVQRKNVPIGYIECKDIGVPLNEIEKTDQFKRYADSLQNLILTDYLEFRYFVDGDRKMGFLLGRPDAKGKIKVLPDAEERLQSLFDAFLAAETRSINTPKELAARMANIAKVIREAIERAFGLEAEAGTLHGELESFRATILNDITPEQFADMYAQTVCYGMFSARVNVPDAKAASFTREHAAYDLPATNPFLREVFEYIAGTKLDTSIVWAVDLLAETLRRCDMAAILHDFGKASRQQDPVFHFYETFLTAYDPALREKRGVYYTPEPVVSYIVRSIDEILKRDFDCPMGLADNSKITIEVAAPQTKNGKAKKEVHRVQILDPATGTGTFLYETVRHIYDALTANRGTWGGEKGYVAQHLLPRLFGFELMMAPYAVAHMKLAWLLKETGYDFPNDDRLGVYLTNSLDEAQSVVQTPLPLVNQIVREANAARKVKAECPIMVVLGNPPYSGLSANMTAWTDHLLKKRLPLVGGAQGYYEVDGQPLGEKKVWLQNDYVKFIRFAQYRIEKTGYGVLGFITDHGYLTNPTFRGMRQSLMQTFDEIYVLDLHGASKKKEKSPDGGKDENVFDIQQGVAIGIFIRRKQGGTKKPARVRHAELWGTREAKHSYLSEGDLQDTKWIRVRPNSPYYFFVPKDDGAREEYEACPAITDIFARNVAGVITARDEFAIDFDDVDLLKRIEVLRKEGLSDDEVRARFFAGRGSAKYAPGDSRGWKLQTARQKVREDKDWRKRCEDVLYRPFDKRRIYYASWIVDWPRNELMPTMQLSGNLGLVASRATRDKWDVHVTNCTTGHKTCSAYDVNYLFPLYLYSSKVKNGGLFEDWPAGRDDRRPNLSKTWVEDFAAGLRLLFLSDGRGDLKKTFGPEDIFHYIYAVFHSPTYRSRYAEFLKIDFPRVPLTSDKKLFARLSGLGAELVGLHLLERVPEPQATFPKQGDGVVDKPHYKQPTGATSGCVHINKAQFFQDVPPEVWEFHVGGYQVCEKWLKDRKGRTLSYDDIETYRKTTEALRQTIRLMAEIDAAIPAWPIR